MILPSHLSALVAEAQRAAKAGDLQQAAHLYNRVVSEEPGAADAWLALARLLIQARQTGIAVECCRLWRAKAPAAGRPLADAHHELGCHLYGLGRGGEAVAALAAATEIAPDLLPAWRNLAGALLQEGRAAEALPAARRACDLAPADPECRFLLAFALADTGETAQARRLLEALADADPREPRYHYRLEDLLLRSDEGEAALFRNTRFHALVDQAMREAAASGDGAALLALERHAMAQGDGEAAWQAYARLAARPDFDAAARSQAFLAGTHLALGALALPDAAALAAARAEGAAMPAIAGGVAMPAVAGGAKRLVMLLLVRDEADIIRDNIAFHLNQGVDFVIVTDNGSTDGTRDQLAAMERDWPVQVLDEPSHSYQQDLWTTRMAYLAADLHRAEWVFSADADEFWWPATGDLASAVDADAAHYGADANLLIVPPVMMVPDREQAAAADFRPVRTRRAFVGPLGNARAVSRWPTAWPLHRQMAKMMFRGSGFVALWPGNHYAVMERAHYGFSRHILIHHFHFRSFAHFRRKLAMTHAAMKDNAQWKEVTRDLRRKLELDRAGALAAEYERATWPTALYRAAAAAGRLIETDRILAGYAPEPRRRGPADGDVAALAEAGRRYIAAVSPFAPRFRSVAMGRPSES